jgi:hypothetical protein
LRQRIHAATTAIRRSRATLATKAAVLQSHVHGVLNYYGPLLTLTHAQYSLELRSLLDRTWRTLTMNLPSFPTALLHLPATMGGLHLTDASHAAHEAKLNCSIRLSSKSPYAAAVIASLLLRHPERNTQTESASHSLTAAPAQRQSWAASLIAHLAATNHTLTITGLDPPHHLDPDHTNPTLLHLPDQPPPQPTPTPHTLQPADRLYLPTIPDVLTYTGLVTTGLIALTQHPSDYPASLTLHPLEPLSPIRRRLHHQLDPSPDTNSHPHPTPRLDPPPRNHA